MNITKEKLMDIIKEEFELLELDYDKVSTSDVKSGAIGAGKAQTAGGINDQERGVIQTMQSKLTAAAESGNIAAGKALNLMKLLVQELDKMTGGTPEETPEETPMEPPPRKHFYDSRKTKSKP